MTLKEINRKTPEGRLLFAALITISQFDSYQVLGETIDAKIVDPEAILQNMDRLATHMEQMETKSQKEWDALMQKAREKILHDFQNPDPTEWQQVQGFIEKVGEFNDQNNGTSADQN